MLNHQPVFLLQNFTKKKIIRDSDVLEQYIQDLIYLDGHGEDSSLVDTIFKKWWTDEIKELYKEMLCKKTALFEKKRICKFCGSEFRICIEAGYYHCRKTVGYTRSLKHQRRCMHFYESRNTNEESKILSPGFLRVPLFLYLIRSTKPPPIESVKEIVIVPVGGESQLPDLMKSEIIMWVVKQDDLMRT
ncbi:MAG: hypothetical protein ACTSUE_09605 [Promethearchaeota archaeon]